MILIFRSWSRWPCSCVSSTWSAWCSSFATGLAVFRWQISKFCRRWFLPDVFPFQFLVPMLQGFPHDCWVTINELEVSSEPKRNHCSQNSEGNETWKRYKMKQIFFETACNSQNLKIILHCERRPHQSVYPPSTI